MPKQKTKSSVSKRFKKRKSGKIQRGHAKTSHLFANKSTKNKRHARKRTDMSSADAKRYKDIL
ncbi:MAG: 50S ribosomal protein L35 [Mycoplasmataceae bacterium]|nr:50S ribosomal protein L35 [Mycoplasmataceae bacterium]